MAGNAADWDRQRGRRWRAAGWGAAAALIALPLLAMQFTDEVNWGPADFVFAIVLVGGTGATFELAARRTASRAYRAAAGIALAAAFLMIWANLAVGIIGSEDNPANLIYYGVLAVGLAGAVVARFRAAGMARALVATALAQVLAAAVALVAGWGSTGPVTIFFGALWLGSAWLFRKAACEQAFPGATS